MMKTKEELRREKYRKAMEDQSNPYHGTLTGYSYGCRCKRCKMARGMRDKVSEVVR